MRFSIRVGSLVDVGGARVHEAIVGAVLIEALTVAVLTGRADDDARAAQSNRCAVRVSRFDELGSDVSAVLPSVTVAYKRREGSAAGVASRADDQQVALQG